MLRRAHSNSYYYYNMNTVNSKQVSCMHLLQPATKTEAKSHDWTADIGLKKEINCCL